MKGMMEGRYGEGWGGIGGLLRRELRKFLVIVDY